MNLLLVEAHEIGDDGVVLLEDRRAEHLRKVLRVEPGKRLRMGVVGGGQGAGEVLSVARSRVELKVEVEVAEPPRPRIDLIVGLPRPQALHRTLQYATVMGVGRLDLVNAWRVEKSYFSSPSLAEDSIHRHLLLGAEQGMTTWLPEVHQQRLLVPFLSGLSTATGLSAATGLPASPDTRRLLAHPAGERPIEEAVAGWRGRIQVAIGPEGGWIDQEVETFETHGFETVTLGPWILRVETAVAAVLAQLALLERWPAPSC